VDFLNIFAFVSMHSKDLTDALLLIL